MFTTKSSNNSILIYLRANSTAQGPITKLTQVKERKETYTKYKTRQNNNNNKESKLSFRSYNNINNSIQFNSLFIYVLNSKANGQLQSQHEYKQQ
jgi:ribosomal 30S subunit maturation factor RimM